MKVYCFKHKIKRTEEKINFFYDYKEFIVDYIGKAPYLPLDTPVSILNKIIYQLKFNRKDCKPYIYNHIKNFYFYDDYINEMYSKNYEKIKCEFEKYKNEVSNHTRNCGRVKWDKVKINDYLLSDIEIFYNNIDATFLNDLINGLNYCFGNKFSLRFCKKILKKATIIFVSHYIINDYSKKATKDIAIRSYGIEKIIPEGAEKSYKYFIFKICNCKVSNDSEDTFNIKHGDVEFVSSENKKLNFLKKNAKNIEVRSEKTNAYKLFFNGKREVIAIVETSSNSRENALDIAKSKVKTAIKYLKMLYKKDSINYEFYHFYTDNLNCENLNFHYKSIPDAIELKQEDMFSIQGTEKNLENLYTSAKLENSLTKYWQYLECLLPKKREGGNQIQFLFKKIMQKERERLRESISGDMLFNFPIMADIFKNFTLTEAIDFYNNLPQPKKRWYHFNTICKFLPELKACPIKEFIYDLKNEFTKAKCEEWEVYYESLIIELREYRNSDLHTGKNNEYLERKLKFLMPALMSTFRWRWRKFYNENESNSNGEYNF